MDTKYKAKTQQQLDEFWLDSHGNKRCTTCKEYKSMDEYHNHKAGRYGKALSCKTCAKARARNSHRRRKDNPDYRYYFKNQHTMNTYGITREEYDRKLEAQGHICAVCETELLGGHQTHLDHDHTTGKLRDFLCTNCNRGIGHFQDSVVILKKAIAYLGKHNEQ